MMRTIHLLRHGKAEGQSATGADHDRGLTSRGRKNAAAMGEVLARREAPPELVLCSSARRALETWLAMRPLLAVDPTVSVEDDLYLVDSETLLERVTEVDDSFGSVLLVGHNPGIGSLAYELARRNESAELERLSRSFPTAALATLCFETDEWSGLRPGRGRLAGFTTPKTISAPR